MIDLYRFYNATDDLLYVGISFSAVARASQHRRDKGWWPEVAWMAVEHLDTDDYAEAERIERDAIVAERPRYNVVHNNRRPEPKPCGAPSTRLRRTRKLTHAEEIREHARSLGFLDGVGDGRKFRDVNVAENHFDAVGGWLHLDHHEVAMVAGLNPLPEVAESDVLTLQEWWDGDQRMLSVWEHQVRPRRGFRCMATTVWRGRCDHDANRFETSLDFGPVAVCGSHFADDVTEEVARAVIPNLVLR